ncbi:acid phosphatase type 7-like [Pollicipes pollicipes]|uniref:acid phosphatase type 7-like n=1 Tax=Pollicipes pollicipes TaxID=41117 RepID=UPI0018849D39|nr:acid phosphatase type 7-like [Pollicipes pollicipes]
MAGAADSDPHCVRSSVQGCKERHDFFNKTLPYWSAVRSSDYGYTRLTVANGSHLFIEQVSDDKDGAVIDSLWIRKEAHKPFSQLRKTERGYL